MFFSEMFQKNYWMDCHEIESSTMIMKKNLICDQIPAKLKVLHQPHAKLRWCKWKTLELILSLYDLSFVIGSMSKCSLRAAIVAVDLATQVP